MAENDKKRYYWLKLKKDFFQQHQIKVLKALPNGRLYALIYLELLAESTSHDGELRYSQMLPYDIVTLSAVIDEDKDNVEKAIETLINLELIEMLDDGTIYMREIQRLIGSETGSAERQRLHREKVKQLESVTMSQNCHLENRDKSIEIRDKNNNNTRFIKPSVEEVKEYCLSRNNGINAEEFVDFYTSKNWMIGKNKMVDWKACVRTWERNRGAKIISSSEPVAVYTDKEITYDTSKNKRLSSEELDELLNLRRKNNE